MKFDAMRIHSLYLPEGAAIFKPENVIIGKEFAISPYCQLFCRDPENGSQLIIGDRVALNYNVILNADCGGKIHLGNNVIIGPGAVLRAANHKFADINQPIRDQGHKPGKIIIEDNVWLGAGVIVLPNVTIGKSAIIGAGSVVTKDISSYAIAVGNPARVVRLRNEQGMAK